MPRKNAHRITLEVPKSWRPTLEKAASQAGLPLAQLIRDAVRHSIRARGLGRLPKEPDDRGRYDRAEKGLMSSQTLKRKQQRDRQREHTRRWRERMKALHKEAQTADLMPYRVESDGYVVRDGDSCAYEVGHISSDGCFVASGLAKESDVFRAYLAATSHREAVSIRENVARWAERCRQEYPGIVLEVTQTELAVDDLQKR